MSVDAVGGVWLDPMGLLALGIALFALMGYAHDWDIETSSDRGPRVSPLQASALGACEDLVNALRLVADEAVPATGKAGLRRRVSGGAPRTSRALRTVSGAGRDDGQSLAAHAQQDVGALRLRGGSKPPEPFRGTAMLAAPARARRGAGAADGRGASTHGRIHSR